GQHAGRERDRRLPVPVDPAADPHGTAEEDEPREVALPEGQRHVSLRPDPRGRRRGRRLVLAFAAVIAQRHQDGNDGDVWPVRLPGRCRWKRLDREGPWEEFRDLASSPRLVGDVVRYRPTHAVAVDWHGMLAWRAIVEGAGPGRLGGCRAVYYNFRVYSASAFGDGDGDFYAVKERLACRHADQIVCLSEKDRDSLAGLMGKDGGHDQEAREKSAGICVLHPPLRGDICELARQGARSDAETSEEGGSVSDCHLPEAARLAIERLADAAGRNGGDDVGRCFVTCAVRMSPEKAPHNFAGSSGRSAARTS
ncbi:hypothetical protein THAOC_29017, partial [Thalassiosira oceanica]